MNSKQLEELLLQSLEHERGGVKVYRTALLCVLNADLRKEWTHYLEQTERHVQVLSDTCAAELVACEAVVLAETKDHADWELIGAAAKGAKGETAAALQAAYDQVEDEEDEHLYHTKGWCRELWLASLGLKAQLPPPEETQNADSAMSAAQVKQARMEKQLHG